MSLIAPWEENIAPLEERRKEMGDPLLWGLPARCTPFHPARYKKALTLPPIRAYLLERKRWALVRAGRRSFKSELCGKRRLVSLGITREDKRYIAGAPTRQHAKDLWWIHLKGLSPSWTIADISEGELVITYRTGTRIFVRGMDVAARVEGDVLDGVMVDEFGDCPPETFATHLRPALSDSGGWFVGLGVSRTTYSQEYRELSEQARGDPTWGDYTWSSEQVLPPEEIASIQSVTDARTYAREYGGQFQEDAGRVYGYYDKEAHTPKQGVPFNFERPLVLCIDMNIPLCVWPIASYSTDKFVYAHDEIWDRNTDIFKMCILAKKKLIEFFGGSEERARSHKIEVFGDYSSASRRDATSTADAYNIIRQEFKGWHLVFKLHPNPNIQDRINAVNGRLRSADGKVHAAIDAKCTYMVQDFLKCTSSDVTKAIPTGDLTHSSDAFGYFCHYLMNRPSWK